MFIYIYVYVYTCIVCVYVYIYNRYRYNNHSNNLHFRISLETTIKPHVSNTPGIWMSIPIGSFETMGC